LKSLPKHEQIVLDAEAEIKKLESIKNNLPDILSRFSKTS
jgi:hypothetical protein